MREMRHEWDLQYFLRFVSPDEIDDLLINIPHADAWSLLQAIWTRGGSIVISKTIRESGLP